MKKRILALASVLALVAVLVAPMAVRAATGTVSVTVGVSSVGVTVSPTTWATGTMVNSATATTWAATTLPDFVVTNTGNVIEDITIKGATATGSTYNWTLADAPGASIYALKFDEQPVTGVATAAWVALTTSDQTLKLAVPPTTLNVVWFDLQLSTPTSGSVAEVMSTTVTITAVARA